jgi:ribosomal protein S16
MATKSGNKGRYICKVGFYDIYAKDTLKPKKESKFKWLKGEVKSTEYVVYHSKKAIEKSLKTKDLAVVKAVELLGPKAELYGL